MAKKKSFDIIPREGVSSTGIEAVPSLYAMMDWLIAEYPEDLGDLEGANICLAWRYGWKPNADGFLKLGQFQVCTPMERALHGFDCRVLLNYEAFSSVDFSDIQKQALLHHELRHGARRTDSEGEPQYDPNTGRMCFRGRGHDIEEHRCIVQRYGFWKGDIEAFAAAAMEGARANGQMGLFASESEVAPEEPADTEPAEPEPDPLIGLLAEVAIHPKETNWTLQERAEIERWARAAALHDAGENISVPFFPECLDPTGDEIAAVEADFRHAGSFGRTAEWCEDNLSDLCPAVAYVVSAFVELGIVERNPKGRLVRTSVPLDAGAVSAVVLNLAQRKPAREGMAAEG